MKHRKIKQYLVGMLSCVMLTTCFFVTPVKAGSSTLTVDKSSFQTELDTSQWNASDGRVTAEGGKLVFSKDSKSSTSLIAKVIAKNTGYHDYIVKTKAVMNLKEIPDKGIFTLGLGLTSIEASMGEPGNIEIQFARDGGTKASVVVYDKDGNKTEVTTASVSFGSSTKVEATISAESVLKVSVDGRTLCNDKISVDGEGRVGFMQTGGCAVTISDVTVEAYNYDRPENVDVYEDFENESININSLTANMVYTTGKYVPYGMEIRENNGNRAMVFQNMSLSYLGSLYKYSNFELTFDVIGLQRVNETDDQGNILVAKNNNFAVSFGDEAADYSGYGYETSADMVVFNDKSQASSLNYKHIGNGADKGYDYYNAECTRDFTIRVSVIDGMVTASVKWIDETNFTEILSYNLSNKTPLGYVHIWTSGSNCNMSIDNLTLTNKDKDAKTVEVDFKSAVYEIPEDFKYEKIGFNYREDTAEETSAEMSPYYLIPVVALVCLMAIVIVLVVIKKSKGGNQNVQV